MLELHLRPVLDTSYQKKLAVEAVYQNGQHIDIVYNLLEGLSIPLR